MKIGYCICGSFCTHKQSLSVLRKLCADHEVVPILSETVTKTDTRFGKAEDLIKTAADLCKREPVTSIKDAEPLGPKEPLDLLVICPCTGNTLAKLAAGITDTTVTMAAKATVRADRPVLIALCSNDALGANLRNIGELLNRKNYYFAPLHYDDPVNKPHSLVSDFGMVCECAELAVRRKQIPIF